MNARRLLIPTVLGAVVGVIVLATSSADGEAAARHDGAVLFAAKGCSTCHDGPDSRAGIGGFPSLVAAGSWAGDRRPGLDAAAYLAESMREPSVFLAPGFRSNGMIESMPALELDDTEVDALVAYLLGDTSDS